MSAFLLVAIVAFALIAAVSYFAYIKGFDEGYDTGWYHGSQHTRNVLDNDKKHKKG